MSVSMFEFVSQAKLPTRFGEFTIHGFVDTRNQQEHVQCITDDVIGQYSDIASFTVKPGWEIWSALERNGFV